MRRSHILLCLGACLVCLFGVSCKAMMRQPKIVTAPADTTPPVPAAQMAAEAPKTQVRNVWPEGERIPIGPPAKPAKSSAAGIATGPGGFVPQAGLEAAAPPAPEDPLLKMLRSAANTPESKQLVESILQALADRPDKAIGLIDQYEGTVPVDKRMFVRMLKCYVNMKLGNMDEALREMDTIMRDARSDMPLAITAVKFCRRVESFGKYDEFGVYVFSPGKAVILYFEPQYFMCKPSGDGFVISLNATYSIVDKDGNEAWKAEKKIEHKTTRYLYDLFMTKTMTVPALPDGNYTLRILLQDLNKADQEKPVQSEVKFEIRHDL